jgi:hypothetical protein
MKKNCALPMWKGSNVVRKHALVWRNTSPVRNFYKQLSGEIRVIIETTLESSILPASHHRIGKRGAPSKR